MEAGWFTRTLGLIPGVGTPLKRYFSRYEQAGTVIDAIIRSLEDGAEQLARDNRTLLNDQRDMRDLTIKLKSAGELLDIRVLDHLILGWDSDYSFAEEGII